MGGGHRALETGRIVLAMLVGEYCSGSVDLSQTTPAKRSFWQRRIRDPIIAQLTQGLSPERIAFTIAVGSACALFPIFGTTTVMCILAAIIFRLNQPLIHLLNQAFWPIHIPAMFGCVRFGEWLFQDPPVSFNIREMSHVFWGSPGIFWEEFGRTVLHAAVAWTVLAPILVAVLYFGLLPLIKAIARAKSESSAKRAAS